MATAVPSATPVSHQDILSSPSSHAGPAAQPVIEVPVQEPGPTLDPPAVEKAESAEGEADIEKITTGLGGMILQAPLVALEKMSHTVANQVGAAGQSVSNAFHSYTHPSPVVTTPGASAEVLTSTSTVQPPARNIDVAVSSMEQPSTREQVVADEAVVPPKEPFGETVGEKTRAAGQTAGQYLPSQETQMPARRTFALDTTMSTLETAGAAIGSAAAATAAAAAEQASHAVSVAQEYLPEKLGGEISKSDESKAITLGADPSSQDKEADRKFDLTGNVHGERAMATEVSTHEPMTGSCDNFKSTVGLGEKERESSLTVGVLAENQLKPAGVFPLPVESGAASSLPLSASSGLDLIGTGSPRTCSSLMTDSPVSKTDVKSLSEPATPVTSRTADAGDSIKSASAVAAPVSESKSPTETFGYPASGNTKGIPNEAQSTTTGHVKSESTTADDAKEGEPKLGFKAKLTEKIKHIGHH